MTTRFNSFDASPISAFTESRIKARNSRRLPHIIAVIDESTPYDVLEARELALLVWQYGAMRRHPTARASVLHIARDNGEHESIWQTPPEWPSEIKYFQTPRVLSGVEIQEIRDETIITMLEQGSFGVIVLMDASGSMQERPVFDIAYFVGVLERRISRVKVSSFYDEQWLDAIRIEFDQLGLSGEQALAQAEVTG